MRAGVSNVSITPAPQGPAETNSSGESLYGLPQQTLKPGDRLTVAVSYDTAPAASGSAAGSRNPMLFVALGVAFVAVIVAIALLVQRGDVVAGEGDGEDDGADAGDADADDADDDADDADAEQPDLADSSADDPFSTAD
jgi:hypothetical protein